MTIAWLLLAMLAIASACFSLWVRSKFPAYPDRTFTNWQSNKWLDDKDALLRKRT